VTVAAIPGHCYAAGALLALAHDYRVMRQDRGWFCLPSVDVGIPFTRAMTELITAKIPAPTAHHLVVSGDRMGGAACEGYGVVNDAVDGEQVLERAVKLASRLADKDPATLGAIKQRMYAVVTDHIS
jgi:Delta3-Delta2-enoyl-CoA isomerase